MRLFTEPDYGNGDNIFFTSDTHFGHANILKYCKRPFESVEEMNEKLITNWNSVVSESSIIFHLGDFAFGSYKNWKEVSDRLKGHIILIAGNHDRPYLTEHHYSIFDEIHEFRKIKIANRKIYLTHFPLLTFDGAYRGEYATWNLFGHIHSGPNTQYGQDVTRTKSSQHPTQYDVGTDNNGFTPISFKTLFEKITEQQYSQNLIL